MMKVIKTLKSVLLFLSLFYITFYLPMIFIIYFPTWFKVNCNWHNRCDYIGRDVSYNGIGELNSYFLHSGELKTRWTHKEKIHLAEVRGMFDNMFFISIISLAVLVALYDRKTLSKIALINSFLILSLLIVLPFFTTFWREIFHPLLFDNNLWINNLNDLSFYIMPRQFFKYTVALLVISCFIINMLIWSFLREKKGREV